MAGKHIVITGASGLIGKHLIEQLNRRGDHVTALVRDVEKARVSSPGADRYIQWSSSMKDGEWRSAIDGSDVVIHLAGSPVATRWSDEQKKRIRETRVDGTRNIVEAIGSAASKPPLLISASAVGYYGTSDSRSFTEESPAGADFLAGVCRLWEEEAKKVERFGTRLVVMRTGIVLDPKEGALSKMLPTFKLFSGGPLGSGRQWFPWIHIDDEVGLFLWAIDNENVKGPLNAVAPGIVTNKEFSKVLGDVLHRPSFFPVPKFVLDLVFGEGSLILVEGQKVLPKRAEEGGYQFRFPEVRAALADLV